MGVPPTVLWGRTRRSVVRGGVTHHDPDWLQWDVALLAALDDYEAGLCACGDPWESHQGKTASDYAAAFLTCPALEAQDAEQAKRARADGHKDVKPDPARARLWVTKTVEAMREWAQQMRG